MRAGICTTTCTESHGPRLCVRGCTDMCARIVGHLNRLVSRHVRRHMCTHVCVHMFLDMYRHMACVYKHVYRTGVEPVTLPLQPLGSLGRGPLHFQQACV